MVDWITQVLTKAEDLPWNPDDRNSEHMQERPDGGKPERSERPRDPPSDDPQ
jgi:hypothetical protein